MASEQPNHQGSDDAKSLPKRRTYRLSEIPPDITRSRLCEFLDSLQAGTGLTEGNSEVFSLATYGSWQVATVSFDTIPDECKTCAPGRKVHLRLSKRQVNGRAISISVTIDCDFYSMTPLYEPADTTARYDIIAVTGLSAHAFGSWRSPDKADRMWLRDFLPRDFPDIRVITWGYYSSILDARSTTSIAAISRDFLEDVKQVRAKETGYRPLILIGHSLGGLVLQKALVDASKSNSEEEKAFHQSCVAMLLFGVPNQGLDPRSIETLVLGNRNEHFLRDLGTGSDYLFELQKDFGICYESMNNCTIVSFYESKDTRTVETFPNGEAKRSGTPIRMVPRQSAVSPVSKPHNIFQICADHSKMVKFQSHSDEHYLRVVTKIKEITESYGILGVRQGLKDNEMSRIMSWISPLEPYKRHHDIRKDRLEGTGDWFLLASAFQQWRDNVSQEKVLSSVLACSGVPGAGKSVICSLVVDHLNDTFSSEENICVACLYCDYHDDKIQTPEKMIGVLLKQVLARLNRSGSLRPDTVTTLREHLNEQRNVGLAEGCRLLGDIVKQLQRFYVCIDALDESNENHRQDLIEALARVASDCGQPGLIHIFFTTRPHIKWQELIERNPALGSMDHVVLEAHQEDIRKYVLHKIARDGNPKCMNDELKSEILGRIMETCDRMFLLPRLQIQTVLNQTTISKRRRALSSMPVKLETAFASTISRIKNQGTERSKQAMDVLKWTYLAERPLTVEELRHALSVEIDPSKIRPGYLPIEYNETLDWDNFPSEESLIDWCLGLIMIDKETSTVRLVHKSLHDYLTQLYEDGEIFPNGHTEIALTCLQYMLFNDDKHKMDAKQTKVSREIRIQRQQMFRLLDYATSNFGKHLRDQSECAANMIHAFFPDKINLNCISTGVRSGFLSVFNGWFWGMDGEQEYSPANQMHLRLQFAISYGLDKVFNTLLEGAGQIIDYNTNLGGSTMLLQASRVGSVEIVHVLLTKSVDVNLEDGNGRTPLLWAIECDHESVVKLLLQAEGVDINSKDEEGWTALAIATVEGNDSIVKLLLQADGIDINSKNDDDSTALSTASEWGNESIVKLLLQADGIDINSKDMFHRSALSLASMRGHDLVVRLLLQADGIDINLKDEKDRTALLRACKHGHDSVVQLLLQAGGIDINSKDRYHRGALSIASAKGHYSVVRLLLQADGIDINLKDEKDRTALLRACKGGHDSVVKLLLQEGGIDINSKDGQGWTALLIACAHVRYSIVKLLLQAEGIDINSESDNGLTALIIATEEDSSSIVKLLLQADGIDINSRNGEGRTALSSAIERGHDSVVKLLLQAGGTDINSKDDQGWTALAIASAYGEDSLVELLLQADGIDINFKDKKDKTALSRACKGGHDLVVQLLLQADGIDINSKDNKGRTALLRACERGHDSVVQTLLRLGDIDINSKDTEGRTALSSASIYGRDSIVKLLLQEDGIDINSKDKEGRTALLRASERGNEEVVTLLLQEDSIDINVKDDEGQTALSVALIYGYDAVFEQLLQADGIDISSKDKYGWSPLSLASNYGYDTIVKLLLRADEIDINVKDEVGMTALSRACKGGHDSVVQLLLQADGIDINAKDNRGRTALSSASIYGRDSIVKLLLQEDGIDINSKDKEGRTALLRASERGNEEVVTLLLQEDSIDINVKDDEGQTALSVALIYGYDAVFEQLLQADGIDISSKDKYGWSPLSLASNYGYDTIVKLLLRADEIDINVKDEVGMTALSKAATRGQDSVVKLLLQVGGTDSNSKDKYHRTPLSLASANGHYSVVKLLLQVDGIDINSKDHGGETALSWAAINGHAAVVQLLIQADGIDINFKNVDGCTALSWAAINGHDAVMQLLIQADGIDINANNEDGCTALSLAYQYSHKNVVKMLLEAGASNERGTGASSG